MSDAAISYDDEAVEDAPVEAPEPETLDEAEASTEAEAPTEPEASTEDAPEEPEKEHVTFSEEQQQFINEKIIAKKVAQQREAERRAEELEKRLQELESKTQPTQQSGPEVPPVPDVWDADYEKKLQERDQALLERARWEQEQAYHERQREEQAQAESLKRQEALTQRVQTYTEKAKEIGISESELQVAGNAVSQFGIAEPLVDYILDHEQGPAITMYLARNLPELQTIQGMDPVKAAVHIATTITPKVSRNLKRQSAPEPTESIKGASMPEKERGPKGAVFE